MKVREAMTKQVQTCTLETSLPQVVRLMHEGCCGVIPVIDPRGHVAGVVTDRDVSMALVNCGRKPINVAVREVMTVPVHACGPDDDLHGALTTMKQFKVRRLPVVGEDGLLKGILSFDDIVLRALSPDAPTSSEILSSLREILSRKEPTASAELMPLVAELSTGA